jgi:hypothetical protein
MQCALCRSGTRLSAGTIRVARIHEMEEGKLAFVRHGLGQELDRKAFNSFHFPV